MKNRPPPGIPLGKLSSAELCRLATAQSKEKASVLIELHLPAQQVDFGSRSGRGASAFSPQRVIPETPEQQQQVQKQIAAAGEFLETVVGVTPRWLRSARAFVATVTPKQLRQIARSPLAKTIRPNRRLKIGR